MGVLRVETTHQNLIQLSLRFVRGPIYLVKGTSSRPHNTNCCTLCLLISLRCLSWHPHVHKMAVTLGYWNIRGVSWYLVCRGLWIPVKIFTDLQCLDLSNFCCCCLCVCCLVTLWEGEFRNLEIFMYTKCCSYCMTHRQKKLS